MPVHTITRESPVGTMASSATCAICQMPVQLQPQGVVHLAGAVFAHELCAMRFPRLQAGLEPMLRRTRR